MSLSVVALIVLRLSGIEAQEDAAGAADSDLDLDDLELEADDADATNLGTLDEAGQRAAPEPVEDFDLSIPMADRQKRMNACFGYTQGRIQFRKDGMKDAIQGMVEQHKMKEEQAMNALVFTWMMTCYMNIDEAHIQEGGNNLPGKPIEVTDGNEQELFEQRPDSTQTAQQASQVQWELLKETVQKGVPQQPQQRQSQQQSQWKQESKPGRGQQQQQQRPSPADPLGGAMAGPNGFLYILVMFGIIFGIVGLALCYLLKVEGNQKEEKGAKNQKKAEKEERKIAKKRM